MIKFCIKSDTLPATIVTTLSAAIFGHFYQSTELRSWIITRTVFENGETTSAIHPLHTWRSKRLNFHFIPPCDCDHCQRIFRSSSRTMICGKGGCQIFVTDPPLWRFRRDLRDYHFNPPFLSTMRFRANVLDVLSVDLNVRENAMAHHTTEYEQHQLPKEDLNLPPVSTPPYRLVVRRGQTFTLTLHLNRKYDTVNDALLFQMNFGADSGDERTSRGLMPLRNKGTEFDCKWGARIQEIEDNYIRIEVQPSIASPVGEWSFKVLTGRCVQGHQMDYFLVYVYPNYIFVLFNPWVENDAVYMANEEEREAYVLLDQGAVFQGAKDGQYMPLPWNFGQFEDVALYSAMIALRMGQSTPSSVFDQERADPALVVRKLTAMIVKKVLAGRWREPFEDGTKPWEWSGSVEILEEWMSDPLNPVKYAQCWVFAGVLTTLCRALGIPCRPVTNIRSAHDTDKTLTVDRVYMRDPDSGDFQPSPHADSIWNFHVWNEIWCTRTDLPPGFDGWQVCDATPQELSDGRYQCGPMSVSAIRSGRVNTQYDGWFIYGEVNADVVTWFYKADRAAPGGKRLVKAVVDKEDVGRVMVTSQPGDNPLIPLIITDAYKYPEGAKQEREQIRRAVRSGVSDERQDILDLYQLDQSQMHAVEDVTFKLTDLNMIRVGDSIHGKLTVTNNSRTERRSIKVHLSASILQYTGSVALRVMGFGEEIVCQPQESEDVLIEVGVEFYGVYLHEHSQMCVDAIAEVRQTGQIFSARDTFQIIRPPIEIRAPKELVVHRSTEVNFVLENPLETKLTGCKLKVEGAGLVRARQVSIPGVVNEGQTLRVVYPISPRRVGQRTLMALFNSDQLSNIRGVVKIEVIEQSNDQ